jgi:hypothetical protein
MVNKGGIRIYTQNTRVCLFHADLFVTRLILKLSRLLGEVVWLQQSHVWMLLEPTYLQQWCGQGKMKAWGCWMGYHQILSLLVAPEWVQTNILNMWFDDFVKYVNPTPEERVLGQLSWYSYGLDCPVWFPAVQDFSILRGVQTTFETHPASYPMGTSG